MQKSGSIIASMEYSTGNYSNSKNEKQFKLIENISVFDFQIEPEDMAKLNAMNENIRTSYNPLEYDF